MSDFNRERFLQFILNVEQEIKNIEVGEGRYRSGAIHFEEGKAHPVLHRLQVLKDHPSKENLDEFLVIASQDFGAATGKGFKDWSHSIFPVGPIVAKKLAVKPFATVVKDSFYDMFRVARVPLDPKQVERLEVAALKLATAFESKIATAVGFAVGNSVREKVAEEVRSQLEELVSKVRVAEQETTEEQDIRDFAELSAQDTANQIANIEGSGGTLGVPYPSTDEESAD